MVDNFNGLIKLMLVVDIFLMPLVYSFKSFINISFDKFLTGFDRVINFIDDFV